MSQLWVYNACRGAYVQVQIHHWSLQCIHARLFCLWTDTSLSELQDRETDTIQSKRLQVLNMWRELQQLEEEIKEKLVSTVTTTATERRIKDRKVLRDKLSAHPHILSATQPTQASEQHSLTFASHWALMLPSLSFRNEMKEGTVIGDC